MLSLETPINELVAKHPKVVEFLETNKVFCVECSVGTCLVKDIFAIHNFSKEDQKEMIEQIKMLINGETTKIKIFEPLDSKEEYSPLVEMLIEEHKVIMELVYMAQYIINKPNFYQKYQKEIEKLVYYFKHYADDFHHGKEEDMLFYLFDKIDILEVMYLEHSSSRGYRKKLASSTSESEIKQLISEYALLLTDHIYKEDNILFPYLDRSLSDEQKDKIINELQAIDLSINDEIKAFINDFNQKEFTI